MTMSATYHRLGELVASATAKHGEDADAVRRDVDAAVNADPVLAAAVAQEGGVAHMFDRLGRFFALLSGYIFENETVGEAVIEEQAEELWERTA